ncbi:NAD(P)-binding protein [Thozetella sp. PMI_491]|nr:NAD(P)-binding protein [Thozetella sp. PMI_491]
MSTVKKTILVTGSTGKQGGALISHLLAAGDFNIVAVTRDGASPRAQKLATQFNVAVIKGDTSNPEDLFAQAPGPIWGVYSVQVNSDDEERQGKAMVDAAVAHGVRHFVYSSGDRGGPEKSPHNPTEVKNFAAKHRIEKHLAAQAAASEQKMTYTILRPVTFFENLTNDVHGRGFARMWEQMGAKKLQFVSTDDIGWFAAQAFLRPEDHTNVALTLAGDELTQDEAGRIFQQVTGLQMPMAPCPVASAVKFILKGTVGDMFRWFEHEGYGGDVNACRAVYPAMKDFRAWLEENKGRWNK